jgi:hypothetical protein
LSVSLLCYFWMKVCEFVIIHVSWSQRAVLLVCIG